MERQGVAGGPEVRGTTRVMTDQGRARGTEESEGAWGMMEHSGVKGAWRQWVDRPRWRPGLGGLR